MDASARAQLLVDELGRTLGLEGLHLDEDASLTLELDGQLVVSLGVEDQGSLLLLASIQGTEGPKPQAFLETMLESNFLWQGGRGATLAIEPASGVITLEQRLPLAGLAFPEFQAALEAFVNTLADWTALAGKAMGDGGRRMAQSPAPAVVPLRPDLFA